MRYSSFCLKTICVFFFFLFPWNVFADVTSEIQVVFDDILVGSDYGESLDAIGEHDNQELNTLINFMKEVQDGFQSEQQPQQMYSMFTSNQGLEQFISENKVVWYISEVLSKNFESENFECSIFLEDINSTSVRTALESRGFECTGSVLIPEVVVTDLNTSGDFDETPTGLNAPEPEQDTILQADLETKKQEASQELEDRVLNQLKESPAVEEQPEEDIGEQDTSETEIDPEFPGDEVIRPDIVEHNVPEKEESYLYHIIAIAIVFFLIVVCFLVYRASRRTS